ncbi:hypothetical protein [Streptomyces sp. DSM 40907]|uniref:hypothetical protein n=1 Tax=Streptomyces kutzneri TaxID=3051179 RepID=UPI0028D03AAC|nr:hypothetical protein [Streptomyces sp. DSM 40907]
MSANCFTGPPIPTDPDEALSYEDVHHCHLLEHEDDDLMRPFTIVAPEAPEAPDAEPGADGGHGGGHGH